MDVVSDAVGVQQLVELLVRTRSTRVNQILDQADFDGYVEALYQRFYADEVGRPGVPPGCLLAQCQTAAGTGESTQSARLLSAIIDSSHDAIRKRSDGTVEPAMPVARSSRRRTQRSQSSSS
jgi:hypothetical protein